MISFTIFVVLPNKIKETYNAAMRYLYTLLTYLCIPVALLRLLWRSRKLPAYRNRISERLGYINKLDPQRKVIWIHMVSVGEFLAATPLIKQLMEQYPLFIILITTTTPTGSKQVHKHFKDTVEHVYLPYDSPECINRFLKRAHPQLAIIMETELWPNLFHHTHKNNIPIILANARLSQQSMKKYEYIQSLVKPMMHHVSLIAAQTHIEGERFIRLGLARNKLTVTGNIKFDLQVPSNLTDDGKNMRQAWGNRAVWIVASTHNKEETWILSVFKKIQTAYPNLLLILVPRHPDRFEEVAQLCKSQGFHIAKRSLHEAITSKTEILLGDTMGEMLLLYAASDIAFVAGSIAPIGGHNLLEPAALRLPIISGHHLHNFIAISNLLKKANAMIIIKSVDELYQTLSKLLSDVHLRKTMGQNAYQTILTHKGAIEKTLTHIQALV